MATLKERAVQAEAMNAALIETLSIVNEGFSDLEAKLAMDDKGWSTFPGADDNGFTFEHLSRKSQECEIAYALNPLIKRGLTMRAAFVWGDGVSISVRDEASQGEEVGRWVKKFLSDPSNRFISEVRGQAILENMLGTSGECYIALPTDVYGGRVQVRPIPMRQIPQIIADPEDEFSPRFYLRQWMVNGNERKALYPALGYYPKKRPATSDASFGQGLDGIPIIWDQPVKRVAVNEVRGRGLGDAYAALPWAYAYKGFLEAWNKLMKSLATFSWLARTRGDKASQAAQAMVQQAALGGTIGAAAVVDPNTRLEAISKSGAVFDSGSGQPLAGMVASALGLPITLILSDPGVTGARAVAETLTEPTKREFQLRQAIWSEAIRDIIGYVIEIGVRSKNIAGSVKRLSDRIEITLDHPESATVVIDWPELDSVNMTDRVAAISKAAETKVLPPVAIARELIKALKMANIDEVLDTITDDQGNFVPPDWGDLLAQAAPAPTNDTTPKDGSNGSSQGS